MKAEEAIRDALQELGQQAAEQPVTGNWMQTGIRYLNRMMRGVDYLGLGYTEITSSSQQVTVPPYAEEWVIFNLAERLAPQSTPTEQMQLIIINKNNAWNNLLLQHQELPQMKYPETLPIGSGNTCGGVYDPVFYPPDEANILTEDGNHILLED